MPIDTWHHGVVARYWAAFNTGGPEIAYFQRFVAEGQPALDLACGTGRLLVPYRHAGLDVDGCDASADMIALCAQALEREGLTAELHVQPMHELALPRRYRTIFICGGFGLGGTREDDQLALERIRTHLEPGGLLAFDIEMPYAAERRWQHWLKGARQQLPEEWPTESARRTASDGSAYELAVRLVSLDPLEQRLVMEIRARHWRDNDLLAEERNTLTESLYFRYELELMLRAAGFEAIQVEGQHNGRPATADDDFLVFLARSPA